MQVHLGGNNIKKCHRISLGVYDVGSTVETVLSLPVLVQYLYSCLLLIAEQM
jgi:hypothetical protein